MISLVGAGMFVGYTLLYAAIYKGGYYVLAPWEALRP